MMQEMLAASSGGGGAINPQVIFEDSEYGHNFSTKDFTCEVGKTYCITAFVRGNIGKAQLTNAQVLVRGSSWCILSTYNYYEDVIVFEATGTTVTLSSNDANHPTIAGCVLIQLD